MRLVLVLVLVLVLRMVVDLVLVVAGGRRAVRVVVFLGGINIYLL